MRFAVTHLKNAKFARRGLRGYFEYRDLGIARATRGKVLKINFGASIHRVIGLDLADAVFEPGTTEIREQWKPRLQLLMNELQKAPAVLRLSYLADVEDAQLVEQRMEAIKAEIARWGKVIKAAKVTVQV